MPGFPSDLGGIQKFQQVYRQDREEDEWGRDLQGSHFAYRNLERNLFIYIDVSTYIILPVRLVLQSLLHRCLLRITTLTPAKPRYVSYMHTGDPPCRMVHAKV